MLVTSGEESVQQALKEVGRYVRYMRKNRQRASLLEHVLTEAPEPVLILGQDGKLVDFFGPAGHQGGACTKAAGASLINTPVRAAFHGDKEHCRRAIPRVGQGY